MTSSWFDSIYKSYIQVQFSHRCSGLGLGCMLEKHYSTIKTVRGQAMRRQKFLWTLCSTLGGLLMRYILYSYIHIVYFDNFMYAYNRSWSYVLSLSRSLFCLTCAPSTFLSHGIWSCCLLECWVTSLASTCAADHTAVSSWVQWPCHVQKTFHRTCPCPLCLIRRKEG